VPDSRPTTASLTALDPLALEVDDLYVKYKVGS